MQNQKKCYFWGVFGHYPQNEIFSQRSGSTSFLPLRHPNFMRSFRKILWTVLEKMCLPTDILTYWQWWNHRTPFRLKVGVQKAILTTATYFKVSNPERSQRQSSWNTTTFTVANKKHHFFTPLWTTNRFNTYKTPKNIRM